MLSRDQLLPKLAEENGELTQAAIKAYQFGLLSENPDDPMRKTNRQALVEEAGDVIGIINRMVELGWIDKKQLKARAKRRLNICKEKFV